MSYNTLIAAAHGHWPLQDNAANTSIASTTGPVGTLSADTTSAITTSGPNSWLPSALSFNNSRYIDLASDFAPLGPFSLEGWLYNQKSSPGAAISLRFDNSMNIAGNNNVIQTSMNDGSSWYTIQNSAPNNTWYHVVATWDGSNFRLYKDGVQVESTVAVSASRDNFNDPDTLGRAGWGGNQFLGNLAGLAVHPYLSDSDVLELYNGPEPTNSVAPEASISNGSLVINNGTWDNKNNGTLTYTYQWQESIDDVWTNIDGETTTSYTPLVNGLYRCIVGASNDGGTDITANTASAEIAYNLILDSLIPSASIIRASNSASYAKDLCIHNEINNLGGAFFSSLSTQLRNADGLDPDGIVNRTNITAPNRYRGRRNQNR